jgi:type I restriction enzyme R subunit
MKSINFEFIRPKWPELAGLGGFAEAHAHADPLGSLAKLRTFCEQAAQWLHHRLIDTLLADAGWDVGAGTTNTPEVHKEVKVAGQPTENGYGYADYVLVDDNELPLAVIEAKKTNVSVEAGRTQAKLYADGLEKATGRRPVIFTNGVDVWLWNDAEAEPPRQVWEVPSKDSL